MQRLHLNVFSNFRYTIFAVLHFPVLMLFAAQRIFMVEMATEKGFNLQDSSFLLSANSLAGLFGNLFVKTKFNIFGPEEWRSSWGVLMAWDLFLLVAICGC
jgi:hypothetical protein